MTRKVLSLLLILVVGLAFSILAFGQDNPIRQRDRTREPGKVRIIKGVVEKVSARELTIKVESIFWPRHGEVQDKPERLTLDVPEGIRIVKGLNRASRLTDFKKGDAVVLITTYDEGGGYTLRVVLDKESAAKARERMGAFMKERFGHPREQAHPWMRGRMGQQLRRRLPPALSAIYLGKGDSKDTVKLEITGLYRPKKEAFGVDEAPRPEPMLPKEKVITARITKATKFAKDLGKAGLDDFKHGEKIVVVLVGLMRYPEGEPVVLLFSDEKSAEKLREKFRERPDKGWGDIQRFWDACRPRFNSED